MTEPEPRMKVGDFIGLSISIPSAEVLLEKHKAMAVRNPNAEKIQVKIEVAGEVEEMTFHELERRLKTNSDPAAQLQKNNN